MADYNQYASGSYPSTSSANQFSSNPYTMAHATNQARPANLHEYDEGIIEQASAYVPGAAIVQRGGTSRAEGGTGAKRTTVVRKGGGRTWEDKTLLEWDPSVYSLFYFLIHFTDSFSEEWFRLFVGDVSNDVSDDLLASAFDKYPSFTKAKIVRDKLSQKVRIPSLQ